MRRFIVLLLALAAGSAAAADLALLVGVARYPALPQRLWLHGPAGDVVLMRDALVARGVAPGAVQTLMDAPTRAEIVAAMQAVLARVRPGDRVFFYFAGHGSQQPQPAGAPWPEPDGLDEVLLPADAGVWDGRGTAAIPNAILDDEVGDWFDALVDRGARVWAAFDTCHAAGMARGDDSAAAGPRVRALHPAELGIAVPASARAAMRTTAPRTDGRTLLFAGRAHERVREEWMPVGGAIATARLHGVFTWHLASLVRSLGLQDTPALAEALAQRYLAERRNAPVPVVAPGFPPEK